MKIQSKECFSRTALLAVLLTSMITAWAQSGRSNPESQPTPASTPPGGSAKPPAENSKPAVGIDAGKYKFVFPVNRKGKSWFRLSDVAGYKQHVITSLDSLIEEMNRAGADGYRLVAASRHYYVALMKFDEGRYEYRHFELLNNFTRRGLNFDEPHERLTRRGFRFIDFYAAYETREVFNPAISMKEEWEWTNAFFYEKDLSARQPNRQILITSPPGKGEQAGAALAAQVKQKLAEGYYPVSVFSPAEMLLERAAAEDDSIGEPVDVQIVEAGRTGEAERKINALAKQGYRVGLARNAAVALYRRPTASPPVSYVFLESRNRNFEKQLIKLQTQGAIYRTVYCNLADDLKNVLIFEVPLTGDGRRREYQALRFDFDVTDDEAENKRHMELTAASKETRQTMERLIKQGFEARGLFVWKGEPEETGIGVLLERESN